MWDDAHPQLASLSRPPVSVRSVKKNIGSGQVCSVFPLQETKRIDSRISRLWSRGHIGILGLETKRIDSRISRLWSRCHLGIFGQRPSASIPV